MPGETSRKNGKKGGRPKGSKDPHTLEKERVLAAMRQRIMQKADLLLNAQSSIAQGQQFLYKIEKTKVIGPKGGVSYKSEKPKLVTAKWEIRDFLDNLAENNGVFVPDNEPDATYYFITTKEPNNMAIDSMLDRTFGSPTKITEITGKDGKDLIPDNSEEIKQLTEKLNEVYGGAS